MPKKAQSLTSGLPKPEGVDRVNHPRALSRSFTVKVMFMGVFLKPLPEFGFGRRIFLKRISEKKVWKKKCYDQSFSDNAILNSEIMEKLED